MTQLVLIRGIPGSGKSTMARLKYPNHILVEADMYFTDFYGNYNYDQSKIRDAHEWCQKATKAYLKKGYNVVVANTFIKKWETQPYIKMAKTFGIPMKIEVAKGNYESIHNVPKDVIERMKENFENE